MRKASLSPDIPYSRPPQPSGLTKQLPPRPVNGLTFLSDSEEYDSIPPFPDLKKVRKVHDGYSSPPSPNTNGTKAWGASSRSRWGSNAETKRDDVRGDLRKPVVQNEYPTYHSSIPRRRHESTKGSPSPYRNREISPPQTHRKEMFGSSRLRSDDRNQSLSNLPVPTRPTLGPSFTRKVKEIESPRRESEMTHLEKMRGLMAKENVDFYVIPSDDAHGSERVAARDKRLRFISRFTGPVGQAIVTKDSAYLFTESTYWLQAQREIDHLEWTLVRCGFPGAPQDWIEWLGDRVEENPRSHVGIDARMISYEKATLLLTKVKNKDPNSKLVYPPSNLVDMIWTEKPNRSYGVIPVQAGASTDKHRSASKLRRLREWIRYQHPDIPPHSNIQTPTPSQVHVATLISSLDLIAYLLDLRGSYVSFYGYLFVSLDKAWLFIEPKRLSAEILYYLESIGVQHRNYSDIWAFFRRREWGEGKVLLSPRTSYAIALLLTHFRYTIAPSVVELMMITDNKKESSDSLDSPKCIYPQDGMSFEDFVGWLMEKAADGYSISGYESLAGDTDVQRDVSHGKTIKVYATKPSEKRPWKKGDPHVTSKPLAGIVHYSTTDSPSRTASNSKNPSRHSHSRSQGTVDISTPIRHPPPAPPVPSKLPQLTRPTSISKTQDTTRHSSSIDALDLASTSRYSHASSRTESTDYGVFYTRRAYSGEIQEKIDTSIAEQPEQGEEEFDDQ